MAETENMVKVVTDCPPNECPACGSLEASWALGSEPHTFCRSLFASDAAPSPVSGDVVERVAEAIHKADVDGRDLTFTPHIYGTMARAALAVREPLVRQLVEAGDRLAFAAGALNIATDGITELRPKRTTLLDALKAWTALSAAREQG